MTIEWQKVTWYSKLLALILFIALPFLGFYLGVKYESAVEKINQTSVSSINKSSGNVSGNNAMMVNKKQLTSNQCVAEGGEVINTLEKPRFPQAQYIGDIVGARCPCVCLKKAIGEISDTSSSSALLTAGWQTYRNEKYGFEVRYPPEFQLNQALANLEGPAEFNNFNSKYANGGITPPGGTVINIFSKPMIGQTLEQIIKGQLFEKVESIEDVRVDAEIGKQLTDVSNIAPPSAKPILEKEIAVFVPHKNLIYRLSITFYSTDLHSNKFTEDFDQLISTFKFISPTDTSTWQTYRNYKYGFEVKWPWKVTENQNEILFLDEMRGQFVRVDKANSEFKTYCDVTGCKLKNIQGQNVSITLKFMEDATPIGEIKLSDGTYLHFVVSHFASPEDSEFYHNFFSTIKLISPSDTPTWQTYRNEKYGFEVKYRKDQPTLEIFTNDEMGISYSLVAGDPAFEIHLFDDPTAFHNRIYNAAEDISDTLTYSAMKQRWVVSSHSTNAECPLEFRTNQQNVPYYSVQTGFHAGDSFDMFVTNKGLIAVVGGRYFENDKFLRNEIIFDSPESVLKVSCDKISNQS